MKTIVIIKETEDLREGRSKILKEGAKFSCTDDLAALYIKKKLAKLDKPEITSRKPLKDIKDVEEYQDNYKQEK